MIRLPASKIDASPRGQGRQNPAFRGHYTSIRAPAPLPRCVLTRPRYQDEFQRRPVRVWVRPSLWRCGRASGETTSRRLLASPRLAEDCGAVTAIRPCARGRFRAVRDRWLGGVSRNLPAGRGWSRTPRLRSSLRTSTAFIGRHCPRLLRQFDRAPSQTYLPGIRRIRRVRFRREGFDLSGVITVGAVCAVQI